MLLAIFCDPSVAKSSETILKCFIYPSVSQTNYTIKTHLSTMEL